MGDSINKHNENSSDELEQMRDKFAGQLWVQCASGEPIEFDFTNVERRHIAYALNGKDIRAKAKVVGSVESKICYLKFCNNYAKIIKFAEEKIKTVFEDKNDPEYIMVHKDKTIAKVDNPDFSEMGLGTNFIDQAFKMKQEHLWESEEKESPNEFETFVMHYCIKLAKLLIEKNKSYGNAAMDPIRVFSTSDSEEQLRVRIDDKLSRIKRGNNSFNEDTVQDLQGYLVLLQYKKSLE